MSDIDSLSTPAAYPSWSAAEKADWLWNKSITPTIHDPFRLPELTRGSPLEMLRIAARPSALTRTLDHRLDDTMERSRPKIIHTQGAVALVEYEALAESEFTGVLARPSLGGGAQGILRMSLAVPPTGKVAVTPGIGLKFFVDGKPSLDLLAMNHTVGQGRDPNLFSNTLTHDLRKAHRELRPPQKVMSWFFKRVVAEPRHLTIDHLAAVSRTGVAVAHPKVPERLEFSPHPDVSRLFRGRQEDYRVTLGRIEAGSGLYTVDAVNAGPGNESIPIGVIRTTTRFVSSDGGDRIFFCHMTDPGNRLRS